MHLQRMTLTTLFTLATTLTISNLPVIQSPLIPNPQVLAQTPDARKAEADRLFQQGIEQFQTSQFEAAKQSWQQALIIYREIKDRKGEGNTLNNLGNAYYFLRDYIKAIEYYQQSLVIAKSIKDRQGEGQSLGNLGLAYDALEDYPKAIEYHQQRLAIAKSIKDRNGERKSLGNLGNAYYRLGDYAKAIDYHQQSLAISREFKDPNGEGKSLGNLGNAYYSLGDYTKAIDYHQQSLAIKREIKDRLGEGNSLGTLGVVYDALGDYTKAIDYHQQSLDIAKEIDNKSGQGTALNNLGLTLFKSRNLPQAETTLRDAIQVLESIREQLGDNDAYKVSIFEEQARTYNLLQQVLIAQNNSNTALEISERGRARAFVELLTKRNATTSNSTNSSIIPPTIEQLQQIAKQQNATLVEYSIIYDDFKIKGKKETQESELYIWVIKPTGEITFRRSNIKPLWQQQNTTLANLVTVARESIGVRGRGLGAVATVDESYPTNRFQQLHQLLIEPIADLLPTDPNARVVFIPQSSLFLVPFPALQGKDGKYLIEKHTILTAPSIQVLELTRKQRQNRGSRESECLGGRKSEYAQRASLSWRKTATTALASWCRRGSKSDRLSFEYQSHYR